MIANKGHPFHAATSLGLITFPPEPFSLLKVCQLSTYAISTACFLYFFKAWHYQICICVPCATEVGQSRSREGRQHRVEGFPFILSHECKRDPAIARLCKEWFPSSNMSVLIVVDLHFPPSVYVARTPIPWINKPPLDSRVKFNLRQFLNYTLTSILLVTLSPILYLSILLFNSINNNDGEYLMSTYYMPVYIFQVLSMKH